MSAIDEKSTNSLIESAMERRWNPPPSENAQSAPDNEQRLGRREYDRALFHRLEQLRTAMGEDDHPSNPTPANQKQPAAAAPGRKGNGYGPATLLLVAIASGLAGAGVMRLSVKNTDNSLLAASQTARPIASGAIIPAAAPPAPTLAATPATARASTEVIPEVSAGTAASEARKKIEHWSQAWSRRDIEAYLACYSPDFTPASGQSRSAWAASRRKNLLGRSSLSVDIHDLKIKTVGENRLKATFLQDYVSGAYQEQAYPKTLLLVRQGNDWMIAREEQAMAPDAPVRTVKK